MGAYVYKVSSKPHAVIDGRPVFRATYAYKPYSSFDTAHNVRMAFRYGVTACQRWWAKKTPQERKNVLVQNYDHIYEVPYCDGALLDDYAFDRVPYKILAEKP
jgi:hypothetical protein